MKKMNIGIEETARKEIAEGLSRLLADTYTLALLTQNFHWNVSGPMFETLHLMFEAQYTEMSTAVDVIAERIRSLGIIAPASFHDFLELSSIKPARGVPSAEKMVEALLEGQESIVQLARVVNKVTTTSGDDVSTDLLITRMKIHEKNAWMLRSILS